MPLSDGQLLSIYDIGYRDDEPMPQGELAGLRAVEAAVRADQIERDAGIAGRDHKPSGYGIGALNSGSRSQWYSRGRDQAAAAIRAQLNGDSNAE